MSDQRQVQEVLARYVRAADRPDSAFGAQGRVVPIEAGYYRSRLVREDGQWKIDLHRIHLDLPMAFPDASV